MNTEITADKIIETDVLVVGGGIAGCCAAAKAKEHGLDVTILEKSATVRSGSSGQGIDHFGSMFPRDGVTTRELLQFHDRWQRSLNGGSFIDENLAYKIIDNAFWAFDELDKLGVTVRWDDGEPYWMPWSRLGLPPKRVALRVHWQNVKPEMSKMVRKKGVNVLDRMMLVDLLTNNGAVVGATAVNTRTGEFIIIKSKATVIATGWVNRIFEPENPQPGKYKMRYHFSPASGSGDGLGAAYRAGAEIGNMEMSAWVFRIRDDLSISFGNFRFNDGVPNKVFTWNAKELVCPSPATYDRLERKGETPVYYSIENLNEQYQKRIEVAYADERPISFKIAEERGFNPKTHRFEINAKPLNLTWWNGIFIDENFKASLNGLYAVGDCATGMCGCACASISGLLVGDNIHTVVKEMSEPIVDETQVANQKEIALGPLHMKDGTEPMELEAAIRHTNERYTGLFKSEGKLREGMRRLGTLRRILPKLSAKSPHYLMRCLECRNILDLAELYMKAIFERRESRAQFYRTDYLEEDPTLDKATIQRMENGKAILERRDMPKLKPEYDKEAK